MADRKLINRDLLTAADRNWQIEQFHPSSSRWVKRTCLVKLPNAARLAMAEADRTGMQFRVVYLPTGQVVVPPGTNMHVWNELI